MVAPFSYTHAHSSLHKLDVRCKLFLTALFSASLINAGITGCALSLVMLWQLFTSSKVSAFSAFRQMKSFFLLLCLIAVTRWVSGTGPALVSFLGVTITAQGLIDGTLTAVRFFLVMGTGLLFTATTKSADIRAGVQWYLRFIPFINAQRAAVMVGLSLGFLPVIFRNARQIQDAQNARCGHLDKNPITRITRFSLVLMQKVTQAADQLSMAMESRCFSNQCSVPVFKLSGKEIPAVAGAVLLALALNILP